MPNRLSKNLHLFFSKHKRRLTTKSPPTHLPTNNTLINNFNSLYDLTSNSTSKSISRSSDDDFLFDSDDLQTIPDFTTIFASQRFFFSPDHSNSIIESKPECPPASETLLTGGVPVPTYSPDPYMDFRLSMQEMVEARGLVDVKSDWEPLHELLLCYLALNAKHIHKFIIAAFADLLVSLMMSTDDTHRDSEVSGRRTVSRLLL